MRLQTCHDVLRTSIPDRVSIRIAIHLNATMNSRKGDLSPFEPKGGRLVKATTESIRSGRFIVARPKLSQGNGAFFDPLEKSQCFS
jgi:hypothetical protein